MTYKNYSGQRGLLCLYKLCPEIMYLILYVFAISYGNFYINVDKVHN